MGIASRLAPIVAAAVVVLAPNLARADGLAVPPKITELGKQNDKTVKAGYLDATLYGADPTGNDDSTDAIQAAVADGMKYAMTTYLPSGTYKVSDQIAGKQTWSLTTCGSATDVGTGHKFVQAPSLVGPAHGARPVLVLADGADGFGDAKNPRAVIHFWNDHPGCTGKGCTGYMGESDCEFDSTIRDVDIVLGKNNAGAVGIQFAAAQYSYLENVSIDATGGYAGVQGIPSTEVVTNISVTGGQFGIIPAIGFGSLVGITLKNQTVAGLQLDGYAATAVTGFDIVEETGAIPISNLFFQYQGSADVLTDGRIVMKGGTEAAISNPKGHDLYVRNVYVTSTTGKLVDCDDASVQGSGGDKTDLIKEYSYTDKKPITQTGVTTTSYNIIEGVKGQNVLSSLEKGSAEAPEDFVLRHLPGEQPWFLDAGVVDVTSLGAIGDGKTDSTAALQKAIDQSDYVFVPRGDFVISATLELKPNTHLFGVPGPISRLMGIGWDPKGASIPYLRTADTADGRTYVGDLFIQLSNGTDVSSLGGVEWRAGRSSVMHQVAVYLPWDSNGPYDSKPRSLIKATGHGGGRWYGPQLMQTGHSTLAGDDVFGLLIDGTTEPLTVYGVNPEHEQSSPFVEIKSAKNVRFFGLKSESLSYAIVSSDNVDFAGHTANSDDEAPALTVADSTNVIVPIFHEYGGQGNPDHTFVADVEGGKTVAAIGGGDRLSLLKRGEFDDAPFPRCGDGVCDGAEDHASCPKDCSTNPGTGGGSQEGAGGNGHGGAGAGNGHGGGNGGGGANGDGPGASSGCSFDGGSSSGAAALVAIAWLAIGARRRR